MKPWLLLLVAGLLEVCWASSLKSTAGFTRLWPSLFFAVSLAGSMYLLALAVRTLPIGTAYAVWVGIGAAGTALYGILRNDEPVNLLQGLFLVLLLVSVVGLKLCRTGS